MNNQLAVGEIALLVSRRLRAFQAIASELGKDHAVTRLMGGLAWGRYDAEWGGEGPKLRSAAYALGFLDGAFDSLNRWALNNDREAQRVMLRHYKTDFGVKDGEA